MAAVGKFVGAMLCLGLGSAHGGLYFDQWCTIAPTSDVTFATFTGGNGSATLTCPSLAQAMARRIYDPMPIGNSISSVELGYYADLDTSSGPSSEDFIFTISNPSGGTWSQPVFTVRAINCYLNLSCTQIPNQAYNDITPTTPGSLDATFAQPFTMTIQASTSDRNILRAYGSVDVFYYVQDLPTPEPGSWLLTGGGMILLCAHRLSGHATFRCVRSAMRAVTER